jgi:hypothetical protein
VEGKRRRELRYLLLIRSLFLGQALVYYLALLASHSCTIYHYAANDVFPNVSQLINFLVNKKPGISAGFCFK